MADEATGGEAAPEGTTIEGTATVVEAPSMQSLMDEAPPAEGDAKEGEEAPAEGEPKEEGDAKEGEEDKDGKEDGAPEEYEDFTAPDGVTLDEETLGEFKSAAKELNLPQGEAQKFVDMAVKLQQKQADAFAQQLVDYRADLREQVKNDPEIGGAKMQENLQVARSAREKFGTPALKDLLDESGLGDHPEVIRFFYNVGVVTSDHAFVNAGKPAAAKSFYDHPTSKPKG